MDGPLAQSIAVAAAGGFVTGLAMLVRGLAGYRTAGRVSGIATSRIASLAVGEVRVTGVVEPAEVLLVSALQSEPCVFYRSTIREGREGGGRDAILDEERAVGFRVRDETGSLRVFPRGARFDVPSRFEGRSSLLDGEPTALRLRAGPTFTSAEPDREASIAALLGTTERSAVGARHPLIRARRGERQYSEARLEVGDAVTVIGRAIPFGQLDHPDEADVAGGTVVTADDPEVAASIAEARASGTLLADPALAWGNAAIPGFGIGRPSRAPTLHPEALPPAIVAPEEAARIERVFHISPETPVVAAGAGVPLLVAAGEPGLVAERHHRSSLLGLLGAALAIGSAMAFALSVGGG